MRYAEAYLELLPPHIRAFAYLDAGGEAAWPRHAALVVIDLLTEGGVAILGGEVWLPTSPGPTIPMPFFYHWEVEQKPTEDASTYLHRANEEAKQYIQSFQWYEGDAEHQGLEPYFNLTTTADGLPAAGSGAVE